MKNTFSLKTIQYDKNSIVFVLQEYKMSSFECIFQHELFY